MAPRPGASCRKEVDVLLSRGFALCSDWVGWPCEAWGRPAGEWWPERHLKVTLAAAVPLSPVSTSGTLFRRRRDLPFVKAAVDHGVGFAHQNMRRDLVLGAAKLA